jgi:hypothetical protein
MSTSNNDLNERIEREFTKHGWKQIRKGKTTFYERPLSKRTYERMVHPRKVTISKRKGSIQAVKRLINRWFL